MTDAQYTKWKILQSAANETMIASADAKRAGDYDGWDVLYKKGIELQQTANNFIETTNRT